METAPTARDLAVELGKRIRIERVERSMAQLELVKRTGLADSTIRRIEKGTRDASTSQLHTIAGVFGMPLSQLIARAEDSLKRQRESLDW
ncbi:XRE family transcriptional regulator [Rhodococcus erythropolis]|nr:XRE family transcriptional regulator [Rhodococcus erythropolis]